MSHHIHHHHEARSPVLEQFYAKQADEAKSDNVFVQTVVSVVVVTAGAGSSPSTAQPTISRQNSAPVMATQANTSARPETSATYSAPSRQQKPDFTKATKAASSPSLSLSSISASSVSYADFASSKIPAPHTTLVSSKIPSSILAASAVAVSNTFAIAAPVATSGSPESQKSTSSHMSGGAKAGLAIGILIVIALMAALTIFFVRRKNQANNDHQRLDDEKTEIHKKSQSVSSHVSVHRSNTNAPRLSLRPVTQMFPPMSEKQDASSLVAKPLAAAAARSKTPEPVARVLTVADEHSDPFGDHAEQKPVVTAPAVAVAPSSAGNSSDRTMSGLSDLSTGSDGQSPKVAAANSRRNSPPGPGPNNVHRVQLDFKPSMEDELELRSGSLVRMLHEYDDGWALCIRLDRSQQGVVPRTCISKLPVKPRQGPPPPGSRGPPSQDRPRGASNGPGPRMPTNGPPRGPLVGGRLRSHSNSPRQNTAQSPHFIQGPQPGRVRSNSEAVSAARPSPPDASMNGALASPPSAVLPARKPVPGQAI